MKNRFSNLLILALSTLSMQVFAYQTELELSHFTRSFDIETNSGIDHNSSRGWDVGFTYYYDDIASNKIPFAEQAFAERTIAFGIDYLRERRDDLKADEITGRFHFAQPDMGLTFGVVYDIFKRANKNDGELVYGAVGFYASPLTYLEGQYGQAEVDNNFYEAKGDVWGVKLKRLSPLVGSHFIDFTVDYQIIEFDDVEEEDSTLSLTYYPNQSWGVGVYYNINEIETNGTVNGYPRTSELERTTINLSYFTSQKAALELFYTYGKGKREPSFFYGDIDEEIVGLKFIFR